MMSWRFIFISILAILGASAWGGYVLGHWLIENGPMRDPSVAIYDDMFTQPTLGADGKPYLAQPPQPLVDGRLGIPKTPEPMPWEIDQSLNLFQEGPPIALATTHISMSEAIRITGRDEAVSGQLHGITSLDRIQPVEADEPPPPPSQDIVQTDQPPQAQNWQAKLQQELNACEKEGFFKRPSCAWAARNKYCEPNHAWGQIPNCPKKDF